MPQNMSRKRFREDEEDSFGRQPPTPSTTPPGLTHSLPKRQRVVSPDAWDASSRLAHAGYVRESGFNPYPTSNDNGSLAGGCEGRGHSIPHTSGPSVRGSIIDRGTRETGPPVTISPVESAENSGDDVDNYDPEDVDPFQWESSDDGEENGTFTDFPVEPKSSQNPLQLDVTSAIVPLSPINSLLHDLHAQRQLVSRQRCVSGSTSRFTPPHTASATNSKLTIHPSARTSPTPTLRAAVGIIPDLESVEGEKAVVTARYEETNRYVRFAPAFIDCLILFPVFSVHYF